VSESAHQPTWDEQEAARLAREACRYVARVCPKDAPWDAIGRADVRVLAAQESGDWEGYVKALRKMMHVAQREAQRRRAA
jgi:hypothetical protein